MGSKLDVGEIEALGNIRANVSNAGGFYLTADTGVVRNNATGVAVRTAGADRLVVDTAGDSTFTGNVEVQNDTASLRVQSNTTPTKGASLSYNHAGSFGQLLADEQGVNQLAMKYYALSHTFGRSDGLQYVTIDSAGLATFSNGIEVNDAAAGIAQIQTGGSVTIADDASITLSTSDCNGAIVSVYGTSTGIAILFFVTYTAIAQIISDPGNAGSATDTDSKLCMIKTTNSHALTFKNRSGSSQTFKIAQIGGKLT